MARPKERYCLRGHDTHVTGRNIRHVCMECDRMRKRGELPPILPPRARLPFAPLDRIIQGQGLSYNSFGKNDSRSIARYKHVGMTWEAADEWACRLGRHPLEIWGQDWFTQED